MTRKPLSKRTRFEIFKRDGFRCMYCGITAVNSVMHVDHVKPVADGGDDDPANLVTACRDCNGGKSAVPLEQRKLKSSFTSDEEREHAEQIREYLAVQREIVDAKKDAESMVLERWQQLCGDWHYTLPRYLPGAIREQGLAVVMEAVEIVARKGVGGSDAVRYFCGVMRKRREGAKPAPTVAASGDETARIETEWVATLDMFDDYWSYRIPWPAPGAVQPLIRSAIQEGGPLNAEDIYRLIDEAAVHPCDQSCPAYSSEDDGDVYYRHYGEWFARELSAAIADPVAHRHHSRRIDRHLDCELLNQRSIDEHRAEGLSVYFFRGIDCTSADIFDRVKEALAAFIGPCDQFADALDVIDRAKSEFSDLEGRVVALRYYLAWDFAHNMRHFHKPQRYLIFGWPETQAALAEINKQGVEK